MNDRVFECAIASCSRKPELVSMSWPHQCFAEATADEEAESEETGKKDAEVEDGENATTFFIADEEYLRCSASPSLVIDSSASFPLP